MDTEVPLSLFVFAHPWDTHVFATLALVVLFAILAGIAVYAGIVGRHIVGNKAKAAGAIIAAVIILFVTTLLPVLSLAIIANSTRDIPPAVQLTLIAGAVICAMLALTIGVFAGYRACSQREAEERRNILLKLGVVLGTVFMGAAVYRWITGRSRNGNGNGGSSSEPEFEIELASGEEVEAEEREYIENILEMGDTTAREVMTPRTDVVAIDATWNPEKVVELIAKSRFSRFPVYEERIDNVTGIVHLRDLLEFFARGDDVSRLVLGELTHEAYFVPAGRKIDDVLRDLQRQKSHLAIVLDEYGGMAGILTIEDLLEEIVGEIQDEYDDESKMMHQREDGAWVIDAQIILDDLDDILGSTLESADEDVDTLGGFIATQLGHIPEKHEVLEHDGVRFTVLSVDKNRIGRVLTEQLDALEAKE